WFRRLLARRSRGRQDDNPRIRPDQRRVRSLVSREPAHEVRVRAHSHSAGFRRTRGTGLGVVAYPGRWGWALLAREAEPPAEGEVAPKGCLYHSGNRVH